ncbi:MAG: hypothetical protein A2W25_09605 [candidate division Zixibacteria bacterium RBG_16_53_22]|nr:MAG: hypothetical protein A2W25_09605 [candidate division Zixibacteria bacterium RBG_16_53_22]
MKLVLTSFVLCLMITGIAQAGNPCNYCPVQGDQCWATASLVSIDTSRGEIVIDVDYYQTAGDPNCGFIEINIVKECTTTAICYFALNSCGIECWSGQGAPGYCDDCGFWSFDYSNFTFYILTWGKGQIIVSFRENPILIVDFDFGNYEEFGRPEFQYIKFLNRDYTNIMNNDKFDPMESVGIRASVKWPDRTAPSVYVKVWCEFSGQALLFELPRTEFNENVAVYQAILPPWTLPLIAGDPDDLPYLGTNVSAVPVIEYCNPDTAGIYDNIVIANYIFTVDEVTFKDDFPLYKDSPGSIPPTVAPIIDPVWRRTPEKNEPIAYRKNSAYLMDILTKCNFVPFHDFQYYIKGVSRYHGDWYNTSEYERHISFTDRDTIPNITPSSIFGGTFPDYVGILDSMEINWAVNKVGIMGDYGYNFINSSGPHKIFLTYDTPLLDTVNILALDKICGYARGQSIDTLIMEGGVRGVYGEGWDYDPGHLIFADPLDVVRNTTGQCGDYANLLTNLYRSIGMEANSTVIFNGLNSADTSFWLFWIYSMYNRPFCLLSKRLRSCDGEDTTWAFNYHAVSHWNSFLCDAALGMFRKESEYSQWWRYYLHPRLIIDPPDHYSHDEPPPFPPNLYEWPLYIPSGTGVLPDTIFPRIIYFVHPAVP